MFDTNTGCPRPIGGLRTAWFVDSNNGDDSAAGTEDEPLRTIGEIFLRYGTKSPVLSVPTTIELLADVPSTDAWDGYTPVFLANGSLQVSGRMSPIGTATVSAV